MQAKKAHVATEEAPEMEESLKEQAADKKCPAEDCK